MVERRVFKKELFFNYAARLIILRSASLQQIGGDKYGLFIVLATDDAKIRRLE
jgi:hypothetical protein